MGYGDSTVRIKMAATKNSKAMDINDFMFGDNTPMPDHGGDGIAPQSQAFYKKGPEYGRLKELMLKHGNNLQGLTAQAIIQEDGFFNCFKPNSLKANITLLKKELGGTRPATTGKCVNDVTKCVSLLGIIQRRTSRWPRNARRAIH